MDASEKECEYHDDPHDPSDDHRKKEMVHRKAYRMKGKQLDRREEDDSSQTRLVCE